MLSDTHDIFLREKRLVIWIQREPTQLIFGAWGKIQHCSIYLLALRCNFVRKRLNLEVQNALLKEKWTLVLPLNHHKCNQDVI